METIIIYKNVCIHSETNLAMWKINLVLQTTMQSLWFFDAAISNTSLILQ
jgi:hypothetical protein